MKHLFGNLADEFGTVDVPGMELDTVHKYVFNILLGHKSGEGLTRREALERGAGTKLSPTQAAAAPPPSLARLRSRWSASSPNRSRSSKRLA
jgi:hypothetical protein